MSIIMVIVIAVSLSMDAFSLSLAYGTLNLEKSQIRLLSLIVGLYHFFMPLLGMWVGTKILNFLPINPNTIVFIVLFFIGIQMIFETFKQENSVSIMKFSELLMFGLAVSIDSFSVGIGLKTIYENTFVSALIFSISSAFFTSLGLFLGKRINDKIGKISTLFGGLALIIIGIIYLIIFAFLPKKYYNGIGDRCDSKRKKNVRGCKS
ncbi:MAG: manganese efflux pump [Bacilli bacterium]